jgi:hypothetical protein
MDRKIIMEEKLELIISEIGEKEFLKLLKLLGYKLITPDKFYGRTNANKKEI